MKRKMLAASLAVILTCYAFSAVSSEAPLVVVNATQLTAAEMQDIRGGFIDPSGMIYRFAVNIRTALNGLEIFTKSLTVAPSGTGGQLQATSNAVLTPANIPSGLSANVTGNGNGVTITDTEGNHTTILNQAAGGAPASIIFNTSNNRDIAQTVNMTLTLKNVPQTLSLGRTAAGAAMNQSASMRALGF